jgi:peroxiredoxin
MAPLKVGDKLPDGIVKGLDHKDLSIKDLTAGKKVIIFGIPGKLQKPMHAHLQSVSLSPSFSHMSDAVPLHTNC